MAQVFNYEHSGVITENFRNYLHEDVYIDLVFVCRNNRKVGAHQLVMGCLSKFLSNILIENQLEAKDKVIYVYLPDIRAKIMKHILQFIYTGKVMINKEELSEFNEDLILLGMPLSVITSADKSQSNIAAVQPTIPAGNYPAAVQPTSATNYQAPVQLTSAANYPTTVQPSGATNYPPTVQANVPATNYSPATHTVSATNYSAGHPAVSAPNYPPTGQPIMPTTYSTAAQHVPVTNYGAGVPPPVSASNYPTPCPPNSGNQSNPNFTLNLQQQQQQQSTMINPNMTVPPNTSNFNALPGAHYVNQANSLQMQQPTGAPNLVYTQYNNNVTQLPASGLNNSVLPPNNVMNEVQLSSAVQPTLPSVFTNVTNTPVGAASQTNIPQHAIGTPEKFPSERSVCSASVQSTANQDLNVSSTNPKQESPSARRQKRTLQAREKIPSKQNRKIEEQCIDLAESDDDSDVITIS